MTATPTNYTFAATYSYLGNAEKGNGYLIATEVGHVAIDVGMLKFFDDILSYVEYDAKDNADSQQKGAIKFTLETNYVGIPVHGNVFITITEAEGVINNLISITHEVTGNIEIAILDSTGTPIVAGSFPWYSDENLHEIELDYDLTVGHVRLFMDGFIKYENLSAIGTRSSSIGVLRIGASWDLISSPLANFKIAKLIIFNDVQHTAKYTPGYCMGWAVEELPYLMNIFGFLKSPDDTPVAGARVVVTASKKFDYANLNIYTSVVTTTTDSNGYWSVPLLDSDTIIPAQTYTFTFYQGSTVLNTFTNIHVPLLAGQCIPFTSINY